MIELKRFQAVVLTDCPFCKKAVELLKKEQKKFSVLVLDHDQEMLQKLKTDLGHNTVPIVIGMMDNGQQLLVGGFSELEKYIESHKKVPEGIKKYRQQVQQNSKDGGNDE